MRTKREVFTKNDAENWVKMKAYDYTDKGYDFDDAKIQANIDLYILVEDFKIALEWIELDICDCAKCGRSECVNKDKIHRLPLEFGGIDLCQNLNFVSDTVEEYCLKCDSYVDIPAYNVSICPSCGKKIIPCTSCGDCIDPCPYKGYDDDEDADDYPVLK